MHRNCCKPWSRVFRHPLLLLPSGSRSAGRVVACMGACCPPWLPRPLHPKCSAAPGLACRHAPPPSSPVLLVRDRLPRGLGPHHPNPTQLHPKPTHIRVLQGARGHPAVHPGGPHVGARGHTGCAQGRRARPCGCGGAGVTPEGHQGREALAWYDAHYAHLTSMHACSALHGNAAKRPSKWCMVWRMPPGMQRCGKAHFPPPIIPIPWPLAQRPRPSFPAPCASAHPAARPLTGLPPALYVLLSVPATSS